MKLCRRDLSYLRFAKMNLVRAHWAEKSSFGSRFSTSRSEAIMPYDLLAASTVGS